MAETGPHTRKINSIYARPLLKRSLHAAFLVLSCTLLQFDVYRREFTVIKAVVCPNLFTIYCIE